MRSATHKRIPDTVRRLAGCHVSPIALSHRAGNVGRRDRRAVPAIFVVSNCFLFSLRPVEQSEYALRRRLRHELPPKCVLQCVNKKQPKMSLLASRVIRNVPAGTLFVLILLLLMVVAVPCSRFNLYFLCLSCVCCRLYLFRLLPACSVMLRPLVAYCPSVRLSVCPSVLFPLLLLLPLVMFPFFLSLPFHFFLFLSSYALFLFSFLRYRPLCPPSSLALFSSFPSSLLPTCRFAVADSMADRGVIALSGPAGGEGRERGAE